MFRTLCMTVLAVLLGTRGFGQTTFATITGSVTDPNGSAITGVTVEVVQVGTHRSGFDVEKPRGLERPQVFQFEIALRDEGCLIVFTQNLEDEFVVRLDLDGLRVFLAFVIHLFD